jgi:D-alanine-D-alanine ligase
MRIALLHEDLLARGSARADELGVLDAVEAIERTLQHHGHDTVRVPAGECVEEWAAELRAVDPDVVFNLCEALDGRADLEAAVAGVLEMLGCAFTGNSSETLSLARRKDRVNALLQSRGVPVPRWSVVDENTAQEWHLFPAIVKPLGEDASVGITQRSVAADSDALRDAIESATEVTPLMVQHFVTGRELNVGMLCTRVLPIAEIIYRPMQKGGWPIVSYAAKWDIGSNEDLASVPRCPAALDPALAARAAQLAVAAWSAVGGRGYGRVDLRADESGDLYVLDVNPNADLAPSAGLARMCAAAGMTYGDLLDAVLGAAFSRLPARQAVSQ